jgi:RHS repeat-associated protein
MSGDTIRLEVYSKYVDPNSSHWSTALTALMSQVTSGAAGTVVDGAGYATSTNTPFPFAGLNGTSESKGVGPKAYLNWLVFDRNFVLKTGGYVKISDVAKENGSNVKHEKLEKELFISQPGYVYVYLSNEETTPVEVYFDDLSVTQVNGPVIQESDYDPFGLTFSEYARENTAPNNFLYNGKELQKDFDLNWYDYGARMYDAALGRWHVIDPLAEKYSVWSPYNYVMNNPVRNIDPDGREPLTPNGAATKRTIAANKKIYEPSKTDPASDNVLKAALTILNDNSLGRDIVNKSMKNGIKITHKNSIMAEAETRQRGGLNLQVFKKDNKTVLLVEPESTSNPHAVAYALGIELARLNILHYDGYMLESVEGQIVEDILGNPEEANFTHQNGDGAHPVINEYYGEPGSIADRLGKLIWNLRQQAIDEDNKMLDEAILDDAYKQPWYDAFFKFATCSWCVSPTR